MPGYQNQRNRGIRRRNIEGKDFSQELVTFLLLLEMVLHLILVEA
jgi:hypothetical protein